MGACCCQRQLPTSVPLVSVDESELNEDTIKNHSSSIIKHNNYHKSMPSMNSDSNIRWTGNGYHSLISILEDNLIQYNIPSAMIIIIAEYCHIGLLEPKNHSVFLTETIKINDNNRLLMSYRPDPNITHYANGSNPGRYDYIQSDYSFDAYNGYKNVKMMGNVIYFEIKFVKIIGGDLFLNKMCLGISVGFRNKNWCDFINRDYVGTNGGLLGWYPGAIGFHGDDGRVFCQDFNQRYGKKSTQSGFGHGDVIGCGYNYQTKHVFYTKNGKLVSSEKVEFMDLSKFDATLAFFSKTDMITSVEFQMMNRLDRECIVKWNFGATPFEYDIQKYNGQTVPPIMPFLSDML